MTRSIPRQRSVRFRKHPDAGITRAMTENLLALGSVNSAVICDNSLVVEYLFPDMTLESILETIDRQAGKSTQNIIHRLINNIRAFMENNERDYINYQCGWQRYMEDIYVRHFHSRSSDKIDIRKQTWRKYN